MAKDHRRKPFARLTWDQRDQPPQDSTDIQTWSEFYPPGTKRGDPFQGRYILGDNLLVMHELLPEYQGKIDLVYADPPFLTGKAYRARIGHNEDSRKPDEWETVRSYQDTWRDGAEYLDMLHPRLELMWRLLSPTGSLYLHLDWHASAYARILLDEIFGPDRLLNEIVWVYHGPSPIRSAYNRKHDTILIYTKSKSYTFNVDAVRIPYDPSTVKTFASSDRAGFGKKPNLDRGKVPEDWWYFPVVARMHSERTGYPTQKPEALMERVILGSSNPGDIVADFFCGSGTTPSVAARLDRSWIACDPELTALQVSYRRLITTEGIKPFTIERHHTPSPFNLLEPKVTCHFEADTLHVQLEDVLDSETGKLLNPDHVVLWEVDPYYDGSIFRSEFQVTRPWQNHDLERTLSVPKQGRKSMMLGVRVMDVRGYSGLKQININEN
jgi:site-specific DNA-methyltransferase (adenine-specific)